METAYDVLQQRGFVEQVTDEAALKTVLQEPAVCYAGFDPTAASLHVGHLLPVMALAHMQRCGHRPIVLVGGGTALIGDPSGKNEMRKILSREEIASHALLIREQFQRYLRFDGLDGALLLNNADWLDPIRYIDFLRDIGRHFSVNRMIAAESYRKRLETTGLNFIEFNYMLLQSFDFLHLFREYGCCVQLGGNDQWGNIVAGIDLIRRVEGKGSFGLTFPLITTASGAKMGKTESGAVWLDAKKTSPYEYYQYWVNTDDRDVGRFLSLFTFLTGEEIEACRDMPIQQAKQRLAYETTMVTHGRAAAEKARETARNVFYGDGATSDSLPATAVALQRLQEGIPAFVLFQEVGLCKTRSEARRLIADGGGYVNGERFDDFDLKICEKHLRSGEILLRAGKKRYHKVCAR